MGCAHLYRISTEHEVLTKRFSQIVAEKNIAYNDKILLEAEVTQLRKIACQAVNESETIKAKFDEHQSTEVPEIFESAYRESGLIADWLEMDWRDGDRLLDAMGAICPSALPEIYALKTQSALLSSTQATLKDFLCYFIRRFDLFNTVWRDSLAAQEQITISAQHLKEDIVAGILAVEPFIGKRSDIDNELHTEYRRIAALLPSEFLVEQRNIMQRLTTLRTEMMRKKLDEKDAEKQRVIHLFQHEIAKINDKHQAEQTRSKAELMKEYGDQLEKEFDSLAEQFKAKEEQYKSQIVMLTEDSLANTVRFQQEHAEIHRLFREEIDRKDTEVRFMLDTINQEKSLLAITKHEEMEKSKKEIETLKNELSNIVKSQAEEIEELKITFAKKESGLLKDSVHQCKMLKSELSRAQQTHKEEIERLRLELAEEMSKIQLQELADLQDENKAFKEMREDFTRKIESQKTYFEEKINIERQKFSAELQSEKMEIAILTQEMKLKDMSNKEMTDEISELKHRETLQQQLISSLQTKVDLFDIESENRIKAIARRYFPKFDTKETEESDLDLEKSRSITKFKETMDTSQSSDIEVTSNRRSTIDGFQPPPNRFENFLSEFDMELNLMKIQFDQVSSEKFKAENKVLKLRTQISEKNMRQSELESNLESLTKQTQRSRKSRCLTINPMKPSPEVTIEESTPGSLKSPMSKTIPDSFPNKDSFRLEEGVVITPASLFGPSGSPYENRIYRILIASRPEYPKKAPSVRFVTKVNMRGVDAKTGAVDGKLKGIVGWNENSTIETLLLGLRKEMSSPGNKNLQQPEEGTKFS